MKSDTGGLDYWKQLQNPSKLPVKWQRKPWSRTTVGPDTFILSEAPQLDKTVVFYVTAEY